MAAHPRLRDARRKERAALSRPSPDLRGAMYEESIRFFTDLFQHDGSVLEHSRRRLHVPERAARQALRHPRRDRRRMAARGWREEVRRGGILGQATTLAKQSGASRTSPILRGNWVTEVLLGEKLPRPPKDVPQLPDDEAHRKLDRAATRREAHQRPECAGCHARIDPFGFALEGFDAIGRRATKTWATGRSTHARRLMDGAEFRRPRRPAELSAHQAARRVRAAVLSQAARLRAWARGAALRRAAARRDAKQTAATTERISAVGASCDRQFGIRGSKPAVRRRNSQDATMSYEADLEPVNRL